MTVPPPPPLADVLEAAQQVMLPAAGAAAFLFASLLLLGRWAAHPAAAAAAGLALAAGNWAKKVLPVEPGTSPYEQLPRYTLALLVAGVVTQLLTAAADRFDRLEPYRVGFVLLKWALRAAVVAYFCGPVLPGDLGFDPLQFRVLFVAGSVFIWFALDELAANGCPAEAAALAGLAAVLAGGLCLYAGSARFMDVASLTGWALLGVAAVAAAAKADCRGALPAFVGMIPPLLVSCRAYTYNELPKSSYLLAALAPLVLLPWAAPVLARRTGPWPRACRAVTLLALLAAALVAAGQVEELPWQKEEAW